ncbi:hypothetical protein WJU16_19420 [Chitinophaga pollutisoli]|uniref:Uncharacterized protein n=1 Tax=Chitinophaga pollutisoli TaxID=3133966 RepID=A0ABZ2YK73_9BACT
MSFVKTTVAAPSPSVTPFLAASNGRQGSSETAWNDWKPESTKRVSSSAPQTTAWSYRPARMRRCAIRMARRPEIQALLTTIGCAAAPTIPATRAAVAGSSREASVVPAFPCSSRAILPLVVDRMKAVRGSPMGTFVRERASRMLRANSCSKRVFDASPPLVRQVAGVHRARRKRRIRRAGGGCRFLR